MPKVVELVSSGSRTTGSDNSRVSVEQVYTSWPYASSDLAETAALVYASPFRPTGMLLRDMSTVPFNGEHEDTWLHTLSYELPGEFDQDPDDPPAPEDPPVPPTAQIFFEVGKKTKRATHAISETPYGILSKMPDFEGGIEWDGEQFRGVDIIEPVFTFSETWYFVADDVDNAYIQAIFDLVGTTNDDVFRGFLAGEVLFLGASGSKRGPDFFEITFSFAMKPNRASVTIGTTSGFPVGGWEHAWPYNGVTVDNTAKQIKQSNIGVYVDQLYFPGAFSGLLIGE